MTGSVAGEGEGKRRLSRASSTPPRRSNSPNGHQTSPPTQDAATPRKGSPGFNGDLSVDTSGGQNDSEAETEVLAGTPAKQRDAERQAMAIKKERDELDDMDVDEMIARQLSPGSRPSKAASIAEATVGARKKANGIDAAERAHSGDASGRSLSTSPNGQRRSSNDAKSSSDESSQKVPSKFSDGEDDTQETTSRKRKRTSEHKPSNGEPPRQKVKSNVPRKEGGRQNSGGESIPGQKKQHNRSASTQSALPTEQQARKERELSAAVLPSQERKSWDSDSSDSSDSSEYPQSRKRSSLRSAPSPVRSAPQMKKKVDRFGVSVFARLCEKGDLEGAKQLLEQSPTDIDGSDYAKNTPLQKACLEGHVDVVQFLIKTGRSNINNANTSLDTPLIDAVENGHLQVVKLLLAAGADPYLQNNKGSKPMDVIDDEDENADRIRAVLNEAMQHYNSNNRQASGVGESTSSRAISQQNSPALPKSPSTASALFGRHAKLPNSILHMESTIETLRDKAAEGDQVAVYELLVRRVRPDNECGVAAARGGHEFILNLFIDKELDVDPDPVKHDYMTPMLSVIGRGHLDIVDLLLKQDGFDPTRLSRHGKTYFQLAEDRRGPNWQRERDMLKEAYDHHLRRRKSPKGKNPSGSAHPGDSTKKLSSPHRTQKTQPSALKLEITTNEPVQLAAKEKKRKLQQKVNSENKPTSSASRPDRSSENEQSAINVEPPERKRKLVQAKDILNLNRKRRSTADLPDGDVPERLRVSHSPLSSRQSTPDTRPRSKSKDKVVRKSAESAPKRSLSEVAAADPNTTTGDKEKTHKPRQELLKRQKTEDGHRLRRERAEKEKLEREKVERDRLEQERLEREKREREEAREKERLEREQMEKERIEREKLEQERLEKERIEQERLRQEKLEQQRLEQERLERERREAERIEKERLEKERIEQEWLERERKEEERRKMLDTLPRALRLAMELGPNIRVSHQYPEMSLQTHFLPVEVVPLVEIDPDCDPEERQNLWMVNFQAAALLGHHDLTLSQYPSWERRTLTAENRADLLRMYDIAKLALPFSKPYMDDPGYDPNHLVQLVAEAKPKFMTMEPVYWIRLESFIQAVPDYPHLQDFVIKTRAACHVDFVDHPEHGRIRRGFAERLKLANGDPWKAAELRTSAPAPKPLEFVNGMPRLENGY